MDPEQMKKALIEKGMSEEKADEFCKAFPFEKKDDKGDDKDGKGKDDVEKAACAEDVEKAAEPPADFDKLSKALEELKDSLSKPSGLSDEEVGDRIAKAIEAELDPVRKHALMVAETSDMLVKAQQQGMDVIRKGLESLSGVVGGLLHAVQNPPDLIAKSLVQETSLKELEGRVADLQKENEDLRKSLTSQPRAVTADNVDIISHPGDAKEETKDSPWNQHLILKAVENIKNAPTDDAMQRQRNRDRANNILFAATGGSTPEAVAKRFGLEVPQ